MILKFHYKCNDAFGWHFVDNVKSINHLNLMLTKDELKKELNNNNTNMAFLSGKIDEIPYLGKLKKTPIIKMSYKTLPDNYFTIITNMNCYLLNDNGKTVEKFKTL